MKTANLVEAIRFPYSTFPGSGNILWPVIKVNLKTKNYTFPQPVFALIDSGASNSVLHPIVAEVLGFDRNKSSSESGTTVSGNYRSWTFDTSVQIGVRGFSFQREFKVVDNERLLWPCILGEDSIFDVARIDFYRFANYFELRFRTDIN